MTRKGNIVEQKGQILLGSTFNFNALKHHLGYLCQQIAQVQLRTDFEVFLQKINQIGGSVSDVYCGGLSAEQILEETASFLKENGLVSEKEFENWLQGSGKDYKMHTFSDGSCWTLRMGKDKKRFVHLHPARTSHFGIRLKTNTLKTAATLLAFCRFSQVPKSIETINLVRTQYLKLSPLSRKARHQALWRAVSQIEKRLR